MTDQELIELLRRMSPRLDMLDCENVLTAADRFEELVKEKTALNNLFNATYNKHVAEIIAVEAKLTKAVEALNMVDLSIMENTNETEWRLWGEIAVSGIRTVLAELDVDIYSVRQNIRT